MDGRSEQPTGKITNREQTTGSLRQIQKISEDIIIIKNTLKEIQSQIIKLNMIENKIEKGEIIEKSSGWFLWG
tara:strand:+ start:93 stop:311 length:219 start_codon:yes stop_codon:yes gene_type:complete